MGLLRQRYTVVSDQSWELARAAFVSGAGARVCCERYGMGERTVFANARANRTGPNAPGPRARPRPTLPAGARPVPAPLTRSPPPRLKPSPPPAPMSSIACCAAPATP